MRSVHLAFLASILVPLTACNLYFSGGNDDPPPCDDWGGGNRDGLAEPAQLLRNPDTGACEAFGSDYVPPEPYPCDGTCGPCYGTTDGTPTDPERPPPPSTGTEGGGSSGAPQDAAERAPEPAWGFCDSYCTGLDELACLGTEGCRGIYSSLGIDTPDEFRECWQTGTDPTRVESCAGLDAYTCSQTDRCVAVHAFSCGDLNGEQDPDGFVEPACEAGPFVVCGGEPSDVDGCYGDNDCDAGSHCNAAEICLPPPGSGSGACPDDQCDAPVPAVCYGYCVANTDPGECEGEVFCDALAPSCPMGTTPGIANGCWTGHCISLDLCPVAECADIQAESMCIARSDCNPYYIGENCECGPEPQGCVCSTWTFDSCNASVTL